MAAVLITDSRFLLSTLGFKSPGPINEETCWFLIHFMGSHILTTYTNELQKRMVYSHCAFIFVLFVDAITDTQCGRSSEKLGGGGRLGTVKEFISSNI